LKVFPFPDAAKVKGMSNYLNVDQGWWRLTMWCTPTGVGNNPRVGDVHESFRSGDANAFHRYLISAIAIRTDLTGDRTEPWLVSATQKAAISRLGLRVVDAGDPGAAIWSATSPSSRLAAERSMRSRSPPFLRRKWNRWSCSADDTACAAFGLTPTSPRGAAG
jgi:hypothetical protein